MNADPLPLRLEVLDRGIDDVQTVLDAGRVIPAALRNARNSAESAKWLIFDLDQLANERVFSAIDELKTFIDALEENQRVLDLLDRQRITIETSRWTEALATMRDELENYRKKRENVTGRLTDLTNELSGIEARVVRFDETFGEGIGRRVSQLNREIESLRSKLGGDEQASELWNTYFEQIIPNAERVFAEYIGLLGGVSFRERGLAMKALTDVCQLDELCALADWHFTYELTLCLDLEGSFTALPGLNAVDEVPPWPILRLGFASWSIWGLPLAGHEFGKLVAEARLNLPGGENEWQHELKEFGEGGLRTLIADTLAAWAEGPAYACALLFLVLDPTVGPKRGAKQKVTDAERAELVLKVLDDRAGPVSLGGQRRDEKGYGYLSFLKELESDRYAGRAQSARAKTRREKLLTGLPERVIQRFRLRKPFALEDWATAETVLKCLVDDNPVPNNLLAGVRHLTNAAWRGMLSEHREVDSVDLERRALSEGIRLLSSEPERTSTSATNPLKGTRGGRG